MAAGHDVPAVNDRFEKYWSILDHESLAGSEVDSRARALVDREPDLEPGLEFSDGPPVTLWLKDQDRLRFLLHIQANSPCFEGHFPGNPILPGIIQLHWAVLLARHCLGLKEPPKELRRIKFHGILVPPRLVELRLRAQNERSVEFQVLGRSEAHSSGLLVFPERM